MPTRFRACAKTCKSTTSGYARNEILAQHSVLGLVKKEPAGWNLRIPAHVELCANGVVIGIAGALAFARVISTMIFGVRPTDAATYASVGVLLATVSLLACIVPAWRATRIQPLNVLRNK